MCVYFFSSMQLPPTKISTFIKKGSPKRSASRSSPRSPRQPTISEFRCTYTHVRVHDTERWIVVLRPWEEETILVPIQCAYTKYVWLCFCISFQYVSVNCHLECNVGIDGLACFLCADRQHYKDITVPKACKGSRQVHIWNVIGNAYRILDKLVCECEGAYLGRDELS